VPQCCRPCRDGALTDQCSNIRTKIRGYIAICFASGVVGALAVVIFSVVLYYTGISPLLGVAAAPSLASPGIYRPLFWGGLWGIPFGLITWKRERHYYLIGWLYFLAPVLALYLIFAPKSGLGLFGLSKGLPFTFYLLLVNAPYGIVTAMAARWFSSSGRPTSTA
jgi:hypothetical protein